MRIQQIRRLWLVGALAAALVHGPWRNRNTFGVSLPSRMYLADVWRIVVVYWKWQHVAQQGTLLNRHNMRCSERR
jgi:hypothetical protein